jgi:5-carboxymethyl-2-hydroxymuconate isomerase
MALTVSFGGDDYNVKYLPRSTRRRGAAAHLSQGVAVPHVLIEYSANLETQLDFPGFLTALRDAALATGIFPLGGIRVRAYQADHYLIADGDVNNAFLAITLRIGHGRDFETRKRASDAIFAKACENLEALYNRVPLGISLEMQEIAPTLTYKKNNLHEYVQKRAAAGKNAAHAEPAARAERKGRGSAQ